MARKKVAPGKKNQAVNKRKAPVPAENWGQARVYWEVLLDGLPNGKTVLEYSKDRNVFRQGDCADSVFYLRRGRIKLSVISQQGKEAIVALLEAGDFLGEGALAGQPLRIATAVALTDCTLLRIEKSVMAKMLREKQDVAELFLTHLLSRNLRFEEDLIDHLFNSSEKRLARVLLLMARFGEEDTTKKVIPKINQEHLAQMVGTTRSRVSHFMNKFREHGFVEYNGGLKVNSGLLSVVLHD